MSETAPSNVQLDPSHIMQVGAGFWASKTLLSAVDLAMVTAIVKQLPRVSA